MVKSILSEDQTPKPRDKLSKPPSYCRYIRHVRETKVKFCYYTFSSEPSQLSLTGVLEQPSAMTAAVVVPHVPGRGQ